MLQNNIRYICWPLLLFIALNSSLFFIAPASSAQARIWLDEQIRFHPDQPLVAIYNMPFLYRLSSQHTLSITRLLQALKLIIIKHESLCTSLIFDTEKNQLMQKVIHLTNT